MAAFAWLAVVSETWLVYPGCRATRTARPTTSAAQARHMLADASGITGLAIGHSTITTHLERTRHHAEHVDGRSWTTAAALRSGRGRRGAHRDRGGAVAKGLDGRSTVRDALAQEQIIGLPTFTPTAIAAEAREAGLRGVALPDCSVAGKPIADGASARCFAEYMRVNALMGTNGATYAQMPRFASKDGKGTSDEARALKTPDGQPMSNPARQIWVTQTALSNALNTSYMAEQISLFGIAVGAALLLVGLVMAALCLSRRRAGLATHAPIPEAGPAATP